MIRYATALVAVVGLAVLAGTAEAGKFNKKLNIGDAAPVFSGLEGTDGRSHSLADFKDKDVLVVAITTNHCPVAVGYEDRVVGFAKKHAGPDSKVGFIAINVNTGEEDRLPKMTERAKDKGFTFPYAFDPSQKIARELGALRTPEFFVFNKDRKLVYMGAFDDNDRDESKVTKHYVEDAVKATLNGATPTVQETLPKGCGIQFNRGGN
jgi:peroxiredoxin